MGDSPVHERAPEAPAAPAVAASFETQVMAKAAAGLFAGGAALSLLTIALPHSGNANELGLVLVCVNAFMIAAALFWRAERVPRWVLPIALGWGTACITAVAYVSAESPSPLVFFFLWIFLYSAYFFTRIETVGSIALVGVLYAGLLAVHLPMQGVAPW